MIMMGEKRKAITAILGPEKEQEGAPEANEMHLLSQELINCVHSHDVSGVESCLRAAFQFMDHEDDEQEDEA